MRKKLLLAILCILLLMLAADMVCDIIQSRAQLYLREQGAK